MSEPSKKSPALLIGLVMVALVAVGGYFYVSSKQKEEAQRLQAWIKDNGFSADSVKVGFFDKSAVITGLKGTRSYLLGSTITLDVESATLSGANMDALTSNGVVPIADSLTFQNLKAVIDQPAQPGSMIAMKQETTVKSFTMTKFRGDVAATAKEIDTLDLPAMTGTPEEMLKNQAALARLFKVLFTYHVGSLSMMGYENRVDIGLPTPIVTSVDSYESKDVGVLASGGSTMRNLKINFMNQEMLKIGAIEASKVSFPDIFTPLFSMSTPFGAEADPLPMFLEALEKEPLVVRGFVLKDVSGKAMIPESITLKSLKLDVELNSEKLVVQKSVEDLVIPPSYYRHSGGAAAMFAQAYGKPLNISGSADILGTQKDGKAELQVKNSKLEEKELGSITVNLDTVFSAPDADTLQKLLESSDPDGLLKSARFIIVDKKAIETVLAAQFKLMQAAAGSGEQAIKSVDDLRAMSAAEIRQEAAGESNPDKKAVLEGVTKLMERSGTLTINMAPETPQPLDFMDSIDYGTPGAYKITTEYAPS